MRSLIYSVFIFLMLAGNCFGLYQLFTAKQEFISKFPKLNNQNYFILLVLPVINIIALAGMWFLKNWSPYLVIIGGVAVIAADIYFGIHYHLYLAIPSTLILLFFIIIYWNHFK
jgi:uncharacterized membrane protein (DUF2068 family)